MKLLKYHVTNFRSVLDSGWIDASDIMALVGENETGKTNLLLPLWKLKPSSTGGEIDLQADMARATYHRERGNAPKITFVEAVFETDDSLRRKLSELTSISEEEFNSVWVRRNFDGKYYITFPDAESAPMLAGKTLLKSLAALVSHVEAQRASDEAWIPVHDSLQNALKSLNQENLYEQEEALEHFSLEHGAVPDGKSEANKFVRRLDKAIKDAFSNAPSYGPQVYKGVRDAVVEALPKFVYYSDYGTLTSRLFLPRVIRDLERSPEELDETERARVRTLRVLFDFLQLSPQEILELGRERSAAQNQPAIDDAEIETTSHNKEEREILLKSAAFTLSKEFKEWWQRGSYSFEFSADGNYFTIWASDGERPEPIQLEGRSHGLQWFFSFFLVFLSEARGQHQNAILLLDEPGVTLHPLAQEDLVRFFERLAKDNQLIYTSHSPFLLSPNRLSDVRVVFVNDKGASTVSADLRKAEMDKKRSKAIFAVDAALGLSASKTMFRYGSPVIVEGTSDQIYMSLAKTKLIAAGKIAPKKELFFLPVGGVKGIGAVSSILAADGKLPPVIVDGDDAGKQMAKVLAERTYASEADRIVKLSDISKIPTPEIEDLVPAEWIIEVVDRLYHSETGSTIFRDLHDKKKPIVPQIKSFCDANGITLTVPDWKVDVANEVLRRRGRPTVVFSASEEAPWAALFEKILSFAS